MWRGIRSFRNSTEVMCRARSQATLFSAEFRASAVMALLKGLPFRKLAARAATISEIASMALDLLKNADLHAAVVAESQQRALEHLSFQSVRSQLAKFFTQLEGK